MSAKSVCNNFEVYIIATDNDKEYIIPILKLQDNTNVLIAVSNQTFKVKMIATSKDDEIYGADLSIDGTSFRQYKTWKNTGFIFGHKTEISEQCKYRAFMFKMPQGIGLEDQIQDFNLSHNIIDVKIYQTRKFLTKYPKNKRKSRKQTDKYTPSFIKPETKINEHSLTVVQGKQFSTLDSTPDFFDNTYEGYDQEKKCKIYSYQGYDINKDIPIAKISIIYIDYYAAIHRKYLSFFNLNHIQYIPLKYQIQNLDKIIWLILEKIYKKTQSPIYINKLIKKLLNFTNRTIEDFGFDSDIDFETNYLKQSKLIYRTSEQCYIHAENMRDVVMNYENTDCKDVRRAVPSRVLHKDYGLFKRKTSDQRKRIQQMNRLKIEQSGFQSIIVQELYNKNNKKIHQSIDVENNQIYSAFKKPKFEQPIVIDRIEEEDFNILSLD